MQEITGTDISNLHNEQAEKATLGGMLLEPSNVDMAIDMGCNSSWFFIPQCREVWNAIIAVHVSGKLVDGVSVGDYLLTKRREDLAGRLHLYMDECVVPGHCRHYALLVKEKAILRAVVQTISTAKLSIDNGEPSDDVVTDIIETLTHLDTDSQLAMTNEQIVQHLLETYSKNDDEHAQYIPSRYTGINQRTNGYRIGKMTIVAARPGKGKSAFMCNEAIYQAIAGYKVGIISLEMDDDELIERIVCEQGEINAFNISRTPSHSEIERFRKTAASLPLLRLTISDRSRTCKSICSWMRRMKHDKGISMFWLDYFQYISFASYEKRGKTETMNNWAASLARTAKELDVALGCLAQISRMAEPPREAKPETHWKYVPKLFHLKETGGLEENAFATLLLYPMPRENMNEEVDNVPYIIDVAKARKGRLGKIRNILFRKPILRFEPSMIPKGGLFNAKASETEEGPAEAF